MKTILITGAAQGLGRALVQQLAGEQNQLILLDKDKKALEGLYDEIVTQECEPALYPLDLQGASPDDYAQLHDVIQENYGQLDSVFLAAASLPGFTQIEHFESVQWYEVLQVNLNANFHIIHNLLGLLEEASNTHTAQIVAILDIEIEKHPAYYGAYGAAKAALEQILITLAAEKKHSNIDFYTAKLEAFQSNTRSRQFPSENPNSLPRPEAIAEHLCDIVFNGLNAENINKLQSRAEIKKR